MLGDLIGGYRIERLIGRGGMGAVYAAIHPIIGKRVAIKVLRDELSQDPDVLARFVHEARAVNRISHPNIVDVFGFGIDDGRAYLAMELLEGVSVIERMTTRRLTIVETCDIAIEIAHALEAAHARDIVHRDLKPDNVFLADVHGKTVVKLLDFGIAKLVAGDAVNLSVPGMLLGTPLYIAPEQARSGAIDGRADIYALGVMLFEMLTGRVPFEGTQIVELLVQHLTATPPAPSLLVPGLPAIADALVGQMLRKDPAARPSLPIVRELLAELRDEVTPPVVAVGSSPSWSLAALGGDTTPPAASRPLPVVHPMSVADTNMAISALRGRRRWPLALGLVALASIVVGLAWPASPVALPPPSADLALPAVEHPATTTAIATPPEVVPMRLPVRPTKRAKLRAMVQAAPTWTRPKKAMRPVRSIAERPD